MNKEKINDVSFDSAKLEQFLDEKGLSQKQLNELAGYGSPNVVNKIIHQSRKADATDLIKFCLALGKDARDFAK